MGKQYGLLSRLAIFLIASLLIGARAYADDTSQFYDQIKALQTDSNQVASLMGIEFVDTYQHASSYYDDLVDHYEHDQLMRDTISEGL